MEGLIKGRIAFLSDTEKKEKEYFVLGGFASLCHHQMDLVLIYHQVFKKNEKTHNTT